MYFAQIDDNDIVINVIVCSDRAIIDSGEFGDPTKWIQTDLFTRHNVHYDENGNPDGGLALRGNNAAIGGKYDRLNDVFYPLQPFPSWTISGPDWAWKPPIPKPAPTETTRNVWNESKRAWDKVTITK